MKNILIINSSPEIIRPLGSLLRGLEERGYAFFYLSNSKFHGDNQSFKDVKKVFLGPKLNNIFNAFIFAVLWPFLGSFYFFYLFYFKKKKNIKTLICLNWNEKIIISPLAKILKLKIIWLEYPDTNYQAKPRILIKFYKLCAKRVNIIAFSSFTKVQLKNLGLDEKKIKVMPLGIRLYQPKHQDDLFFNIAKHRQADFHRKYFTVGTVLELEKGNQIENLFQAARKCLTVIPNLQIIIVGEGEERKNLTWLAKRLEIDNLVWFVGFQEHLKKWLESFNVFVTGMKSPNLVDYKITLRAMASGLPVVAWRNIGFEDMITESKSGFLIEAGNSEILAREIIKLFKDKRLSSSLGKNAKEQVDNNFRLDKVMSKWEEVLDAR